MARHNDAYAEATQHSNQEHVDEFITFNPDATGDVFISHPSGGRGEIELRKPLLVAMARENWSKSTYDDEDTVDAVFDEALCDVAELALQNAGVGECQIELSKLRALMFRVAHDLSSFQDLADYVADYSTTECKRFGLYPTRGQSSYRKAAKRLKENNQFASLREACFIAVHALFWNGVPIPDAVQDRYEVYYDMGPSASDFSPATRQLALYNLVADLLAITVQNLSLKRGSNSSRTLRSLIGVFAYTARHDESIEDYGQTAQHAFDLSDALAGPTIRAHIDEMALWEIEEMFNEINQALLAYVIDSGAVSQPLKISYDLTDMQSLGINDFHVNYQTEDGRWRFAALSITDSDLEFVFGMRFLKNNSQRSGYLENFLRDLTSMVDVELLMTDRGFDGQEDIDACRKFVPGSWVICAQDDSSQQGQDADFARLRADLEPGKTAVRRSAGFDNLHPPVKLIGYSGAHKSEDTPEPVRAFYTGMSIPDDREDREQLITRINFRYNKRARIESVFRMAKNHFDVATDTDKLPRKTFYFHTSVLFYNLYKIVKTVPSPNHGLELDTTQNELLEILHNLALDGPAPPTALTYHREHY